MKVRFILRHSLRTNTYEIVSEIIRDRGKHTNLLMMFATKEHAELFIKSLINGNYDEDGYKVLGSFENEVPANNFSDTIASGEFITIDKRTDLAREADGEF